MIRRYKTPITIQLENVECGAASVCIILGYFGQYISLDQIREELQISRDGSSVKNLIAILDKHHIQAKATLSNSDNIKKELKFPVILFWDNCHFLVLERYKNGYYYLNDPACGRIKVTEENFKKHFSNIIIQCTTKPNFKRQKKTYKEEKFLFSGIIQFRFVFGVLIFLGFFYSIAALSVALFGKVFIDYYLIQGIHNWLIPMVGIMLFIAFSQFLLTAIIQIILRRLNYKILLSSNYNLANHLFRLPISFFNQRNLGDLTTRHNSNTNISQFVSEQLYTFIVSILQMIIFGTALFFLSFEIFCLIIIFIFIDLIYYIRNHNINYEKNIIIQMQYSKLASDLESSIQSIETVKATGQEQLYYNQWLDALINYANQLKLHEKQNLKIQSFTEFLSQAKPILILAMGGFIIHDGSITIGGLVAFTFIANYFFNASEQLFQIGFSWQQIKADLTRVIDVMETKIDKRYQGKEVLTKDKAKGDLIFDNVTYGYNKNLPAIISDFSLKIKSGEQIIIMGATGSGKSTLMKLLQGIYQPWEGKVTLDGRALFEYEHQSIANNIGSIDQNLFLFEGTLRENLLLGNCKVEDEIVLKLINEVGLSDLLAHYRKGLDMPIKEHGKNISGGQAQLIEIIRAILLKPNILIMDEATSALDSITIKKVMNLLRKLSTTNIMISHQPSLVMQSDRIILLKNGKILDSGSHDSLYEKSNYYRLLINKG